MNTTRFVTTLATAAALAGGIGFAYAQTAGNTSQSPSSTDSTMSSPTGQRNSSQGAGNMSNNPSTTRSSNQGSSSDSSSTPSAGAQGSDAATPSERAPKADRG